MEVTHLKIKSCEQCECHSIKHKEGLEDSYVVRCNHPKQTDKDPEFTHKIRFQKRIYFDCPFKYIRP